MDDGRPLPSKEAVYYISGPNFAGGMTLEKADGGEWRVRDCPPYLRRMIAGVPVREIGDFLRAKGYRVERLGD